MCCIHMCVLCVYVHVCMKTFFFNKHKAEAITLSKKTKEKIISRASSNVCVCASHVCVSRMDTFLDERGACEAKTTNFFENVLCGETEIVCLVIVFNHSDTCLGVI